jgi:hypothetical protein
MFNVYFWLEILVFIALGVGISAVVGALLFMVLRRFGRKSDVTARRLIGYGVFVAGWLVLPKPAADMLGLRNKIFRFCFCLISPITSLFKTTAVLHGFAPPYATESVTAFCVYYASPMTLLHDPKSSAPVPVSFREAIRCIRRFVVLLFVTGGFQSLFFLLECFPKFGKYNTKRGWQDVSRLWDLGSWKDTFLYAMLFQLYLTTFGEGLRFLTEVLTGTRAQPMMDNPMLEATSPSDFWGRRWNLIIHNCLKEGVYKPVRQAGGSPACAVIASFVASGLFHEWLLPVVFYDYDKRLRKPGYTLLFFAWNAGLVCLEIVLRDSKWLAQVSQRLPKPLRTLLMLLLALPVGHLFCDTYVRSDFFIQGSVAFPMFLPSSVLR